MSKSCLESVRLKNRRKKRVKEAIKKSTKDRSVLRLSLFRSKSNIYAQIIDDQGSEHGGKTLAYISSYGEKARNVSVDLCSKLGKNFGKLCTEKGIKKVVFDRNGFKAKAKRSLAYKSLKNKGLIYVEFKKINISSSKIRNF